MTNGNRGIQYFVRSTEAYDSSVDFVQPFLIVQEIFNKNEFVFVKSRIGSLRKL